MSRLSIAALACVLAACNLAARPGEYASERGTLVLSGATIYPSPEAAPLADGVVIVRAGKIVAVGGRDAIAIPGGATVIACRGQFLVAGFQNSHVHFTEAKWERAGSLPVAQLSAQLAGIALRWGYTTVVDIGSDLANTVALRERVERGEVAGPRILTAGMPLYPVDGLPWYLRDSLPPAVLKSLPRPATAAESAAVAARQIDEGANAVKLFTGSGMGAGQVKVMSLAVARAAADAAHRRGGIVFTHASNLAGLDVALDAGVDVVAHVLDDASGFGDAQIRRMKRQGMSVIPTLKLFGQRRDLGDLQRQLGALARAGVPILFGTDVGFIADQDPTMEYTLMAGAGLSWREVLASLTTAPAERFGEGGRRGRIAPGMDADLVLLDADPAAAPNAFARVVRTLRGGRVVYDADRQAPAAANASRPTAPPRQTGRRSPRHQAARTETGVGRFRSAIRESRSSVHPPRHTIDPSSLGGRDRRSPAVDPAPSPGSSERARQPGPGHAFGGMFTLRWNVFSGSYFALIDCNFRTLGPYAATSA